ncbi:MAG: hypothetical protein KIS91_14520 [Anaerolineae bacterium]|nr:hypothetical protein [Anaerolineae bacterium]
MRLVDYLVARDGPPAPSGLAYDYVVAADGLWVQAENGHLAARVPVAHCEVRGLAALHPVFTLKHGRVPDALWAHIVDVAQAWAAEGQEVLLTVRYTERLGYHLVVPRQATTATEVAYLPAPDVVLEVHSHHRYDARFSPTDDDDEQRLAVYGVLGRLDQEQPEVALRVGVYGAFIPVPWEDVFEGGRGEFRDAHFDPETREADDELLH